MSGLCSAPAKSHAAKTPENELVGVFVKWYSVITDNDPVVGLPVLRGANPGQDGSQFGVVSKTV